MTLEIPSLGRPFSLGMLYNCYEEKLIPGITLWNREDLANNISTTPQNSTDFEVLASDTVSGKSSALDVSGELKLSLWSGMVQVGGSGKYFTDTKESKKQARVTLKYLRTTRFDQLGMNHLCQKNITYKDVLDKGIATHVVTAILYGAQAFFIFDKKISNAETTKDVKGKITGMVMKIGNLTGEVKMNEAENEEVRQFNCKFHGDFALEKNPVNYEEAVTTYASLPKLLGEDGEKAVPIKVWLYPLKNLDDRAASLVRQISDHLVFTAETILQQMSEVVRECNDMMRHPAAIAFPALNKISQFKKLFEYFRVKFQKQLSQVLPAIRCGKKKESILANILTSKEKSPFRDKNIRTFLIRRWQEMETVHSLLKQLKGFRVVSEERELMREILDPNFPSTFCVNFSSLASADPYLSHLESWLHKETWDLQDSFNEGETKQWFEQSNIHKKVEIIDQLYGLQRPRTNRLVTSVECSECAGIGMHYYKKGKGMTPECLSPVKYGLIFIVERLLLLSQK
ncbi:neoverrucotoxin subunit alpha-like [Bufo gargarizans]|uniref:neoverrucotoxin subunit alpha-like n=1 Tax=Bufo gargarizans TaxID=30331 RepID=UPI001CF10BEE|nr:neoverrucotoxin subunit alpha-like [Bufo gargarizans]XP_044148990.1 neoverrucotoxin subunit alpha-like [Bufo gargarizans]XP_044148991.1 neoverrucotoxin subunit alpha-like [Bufo gargarizans]